MSRWGRGGVAHIVNEETEGETELQEEEDVPGIRIHPAHEDLAAPSFFNRSRTSKFTSCESADKRRIPADRAYDVPIQHNMCTPNLPPIAFNLDW